MKSPCVHLLSCSVDSNYQCDTCEMYHADILPILRRLWNIYCERADRFMNQTSSFAVWWGKRLAVEQIILHLERGENE